MLAFIDLEHPSLSHRFPRVMERVAYRRLRTKYLLEELSGYDCLIVRYDRVETPRLLDLAVQAVVVSGNHTDLDRYAAGSLDGLKNLLRALPLPMLCICGSHQLLAEVHGVEIGPIGEADPDNPAAMGDDTLPSGVIYEKDFSQVDVLQDDPLFAGLPNPLTVYQHHYWEARDVPKGFTHLASSQTSPVQAIKHSEKPCYGVQFHPEDYDEAHPHGLGILRNFVALALG